MAVLMMASLGGNHLRIDFMIGPGEAPVSAARKQFNRLNQLGVDRSPRDKGDVLRDAVCGCAR